MDIELVFAAMLSNLMKRRSRAQPAREPIYFTRIQNLKADEWQAALSEGPENASRYVYAAASNGEVQAQLVWAQMLLDGYGTRRDPEGAFRWFGIAAASKRPDAINMLGRCYECGWGTAIDFEAAATHYREAAAQSLDWAQFNLGCLMLEGKGVPQDHDAAFDLFSKASAQGHVKSMTMVGHCYENGWGRPRDIHLACLWYRRGAEGGDFRGQYRYGRVLLQHGLIDEALIWLNLAVDTMPPALCRPFADELLGESEPRVRHIGMRAQGRADERVITDA